jgi:hypothetical protein
MKFKYVGDEFTEVFGIQWKPGDTQDVASAYAANKLRFHPMFEAADAKDKPKAGDKPAAMVPELGLDVTVQKVIQRTNEVIAQQIARADRDA